MLRVSSNPFFSYMIKRIDGAIDTKSPTKKATPASSPSPGAETVEDAWGWSIKDVFASILTFTRSRPEALPESP
ncbi:MAG TPA: hypothetical protein VKD19_12715 [Pseudolabrys sp.]|nr:hypothetical protein [Pseudolabrys sp.]